MDEKEIIKNLGTIAKSGTKEFLEKLKKAKDENENNLIGQF
jgi:molecular chaperone HtpG